MEIRKIIIGIPLELIDELLGYFYEISSKNIDSAQIVLKSLLNNKDLHAVGVNKDNISAICLEIVRLQNQDMSIGEFVQLIDETNIKEEFVNSYCMMHRQSKILMMQSKTSFFDLCEQYQKIKSTNVI